MGKWKQEHRIQESESRRKALNFLILSFFHASWRLRRARSFSIKSHNSTQNPFFSVPFFLTASLSPPSPGWHIPFCFPKCCPSILNWRSNYPVVRFTNSGNTIPPLAYIVMKERSLFPPNSNWSFFFISDRPCSHMTIKSCFSRA